MVHLHSSWYVAVQCSVSVLCARYKAFKPLLTKQSATDRCALVPAVRRALCWLAATALVWTGTCVGRTALTFQGCPRLPSGKLAVTRADSGTQALWKRLGASYSIKGVQLRCLPSSRSNFSTARRVKMVCPMCITAAIVANAPGIAAAVGGFAAAKVALDKRDKRVAGKSSIIDTRPMVEDTPVSRIVVDRRELPAITLSREDF